MTLEKLRRFWQEAWLYSRVGLVAFLKVRWLLYFNFYRKNPRPKIIRLQPSGVPHPFYLRTNGSDAFVFWGSLIVQDYSALPQAEHANIIDLGANIGASTLYFVMKNPNSRVVAVECDHENFRLCSMNLDSYPQVTCIHAPIWAEDGVPIAVEDHAAEANQFWARRTVVATAPQSETLMSLSMNSLIKKLSFSRVHILKIDIEGAEESLFSKNCEWLRLVDNIAIELHSKSCADVFFKALEPFSYERGDHGEYVICKNLRIIAE